MKQFIKLSFLALYGLVACNRLTENGNPNREYLPDPDPSIHQRLEEWQDLKFGLLMHWGTYSQWGVVESWSICPEDVGWECGARKKMNISDNYNDYVKAYKNLQTTFNPIKFNPDKWAAAAKEAGMKYLIFTAKHHDGFCMFDSKYTDYKITDKKTPFSSNPRSNITKELFDAFRKQDFWVGASFSKPDWNCDYYWWKWFPVCDRNANYTIKKYPEQWKKFKDFTHNQINELASDYGRLDILWLDGGWVKKLSEKEVNDKLTEEYDGIRWMHHAQNQDIDIPQLVNEVRAKQPKLLIVDRGVTGPNQNYLTPEQQIPPKALPYPWETCMSMATSFSFVPHDTYKPCKEIIEKLVDIVSKGGNYLLNIGPGPDGELDSIAYVRLKEIGAWMKVNSEAIYGTRMYKVFNDGENIRYTQSKDGKTKYIFLVGFPNEKVLLSKINFSKKNTLQMLGSDQKLTWADKGGKMEIEIPAALKSVTNDVWVIKVSEN